MTGAATATEAASTTRTSGEPIIKQSPTVRAGGRTVVILPGPVATVSARRPKKK